MLIFAIFQQLDLFFHVNFSPLAEKFLKKVENFFLFYLTFSLLSLKDKIFLLSLLFTDMEATIILRKRLLIVVYRSKLKV